MLFSVPLAPKNEIHLNGENENKLLIPNRWEDWVTQTLLFSGDGDDGIAFHPYDFQIKIAELIRDYSCIFVKSRQTGCTTVVSSYLMYRALKSRSFAALWFSRTQTDSSKIAGFCQETFKHLNTKMATDNVLDQHVQRGGKLSFKSSDVNSPRGYSNIKYCIYDECAFHKNLNELRNNASPTMDMAENGRELFISTPDSPTGLFYQLADAGNEKHAPLKDICKAIVAGELPPFYWFIDENGFAKIFVHWRAIPKQAANPNFLNDKRKKGITEEKLNREYQLSFTSPEFQYFNPIHLERCWVENFHGKNDDGIIAIGIDCNDGGSNYFCVSVWKLTDDRKLTKIDGYLQNYGDFDYHLSRTLLLLNNYPHAICCVEKNSAGNTLFGQIKMRMPTLKMHLITVSGESKPTMITRMKFMIERNRLFWEKEDPIQKHCEDFRHIEETNSFEAATGCFDDEISACCTMLQGLENDGLLGGW